MMVSVQGSMGDAGTRLLNPGIKAQVRCGAHRRVVRRGVEAPVRRRLLSSEDEVGLMAHWSDTAGVDGLHGSV